MDRTSVSVEEARTATPDDLALRLGSGREGLSADEAGRKLQEYGYNEVPEKKRNPILHFLSYFWGPIPWMIEAALVLTAVSQKLEDFGIILVLLLFNAIVGFFQENQAENTIALLRKNLAVRAVVRRDSRWIEVPARELVPGDVVRIRLGDIVPADMKLIEGNYLLVDESALTGESLPVEKSRSDIVYSSSIVRQGEMDALVFATGPGSFFGRTTQLVTGAKAKSHFQKAIEKIGNFLIALAVSLAAVVFMVALFRKESLLENLQFVLVLVVAAIPAAVGATALAARGAIVSRLVSIEEMSGMDTLCSDKTGTITKNDLSVAETRSYSGFTDNDVLLAATLASRQEDRDPIDLAIIAHANGVPTIADRRNAYRVVDFTPFDPVSKRTCAKVIGQDGTEFSVTKGAPQVIIHMAEGDQALSAEATEAVDLFASRGFRSLGVAWTDPEGKWRFAGLIALYDPPREDSAETIREAIGMGIDVKMITGDNTAIAREIARQVHLGQNITTADSFLGKPDSEAQQAVAGADGFAQVFPEHKYRIVELLQAGGRIVGMTGDGVNDVPALQRADVGIAVAGATDAAKSAASIILTQSGLSTIIDAVKESRETFSRMKNYAIYRITETIRVLLFITASILAFNFYPVTALMIVLLALLNDFPIMTIAYDNVLTSDRPERWDMRELLGIATILGTFGVIESFGLLYIGLNVLHLSTEILQSFIYLKLSVAGHLILLVARTRGPFWSVRPAVPVLAAVILTQLTATLIVVYGILLPAIGWGLALLVWGYSLIMFLVADRIKILGYALLEHRGIRFRQ
jgi:H+-transporting ATPase